MMTNEERDLLLKDLCGRLHTFLYVNIKGNIQVLNSWADDDGNLFNFLDDGPDGNYGEGFTLDDVKPYLRPLSSMTEEENKEFQQVIEIELKALQGPSGFTVENAASSAFQIDFYNKHHFDYRGLIPLGLALTAPAGMYV